MKYFSAYEAKQHFGKLIASADAEPVAITRYKRPVAYVISASDFAEFETLRARDQRSRVSALLSEIAANDGYRGDVLTRKLKGFLRKPRRKP
ncbi:MAG: type II toxin-antitoxin system Phd/YefM family antitoxin [Alphaproteobacteria bacterium]|nr:type II toxin-antitoxin system Phd/YefM family antitoxin [Alphaproteobacteria bacterium]